jgi:uncharacterized protein (TIGR02246 family)
LKAPGHIATERLVLRKPEAGDAEPIFQRYASDPEVTRYLSWRRHESIGETRAFLAFSDGEWQRSPAGPYLIETREGRLIGGTGLEFKSADEAATGYVLARDAWGTGYATEALRAIVSAARELGVRRLRAHCHPQNIASERVLKKCGFTQEPLQSRAEFPNLGAGEIIDVMSYVCEPLDTTRRAIVLGAACAIVSPASAAAAGQSDEQAIRKLVSDMQDAWNRGDFRGYMQGFKNPDVIFISGGHFQSGWQGTLEHYVRDYGGTIERRGTLHFHDMRIELLAPDAAQLVSQFSLERPERPQYGVNSRLLRKIDGRWVITVTHVSAAETPIDQKTPPLGVR